MREPPNEGPDDWYFDESLQSWGRHSGRARWRAILTAHNTPEARATRRASSESWLARYGLRRVEIPGKGATIEPMEQDTNAAESVADLVARTGAAVTPEGRQRARKRLADSRRRHAENPTSGAEFLAGLHTGTA
jgi:hypothetical protein